MKSIYQKMVEAGVQIDHHESDLYVPVNSVTKLIVGDYKFKNSVTRFKSNIEPHDIWYDIPFAYDPWWTDKR